MKSSEGSFQSLQSIQGNKEPVESDLARENLLDISFLSCFKVVFVSAVVSGLSALTEPLTWSECHET